MFLYILLNCGSINPVVFLVGPHETEVDDAKLILNGCHNSVRIAFDVEDNPVVSHKAGITVNTLDVSWRSPFSLLHIGIPSQQRLLRIRVSLPEVFECFP
jgi:hypothetical protein